MYCFKWDGMWINTEYLKDITHPQKSSLEYTVTRLVGQDKALRKEAMRIITTKNVTLIRPLGKWTRTGYTKQIALLLPKTGLLYVKEETGWRIYIYQISVRSERWYTTYRPQVQV